MPVSTVIRRRVRARTVIAEREGDHLVIRRRDPRPPPLTPAQSMARTGLLGDDVVPLLDAADWFEGLAMQAGLRGRLERSSLAGGQAAKPASHAVQLLARLSAAIGPDAYGVLIEGCVWHHMIAPARQPLFRAALYAVHVWRQAQTQKPPPA